MDCQESNGQKRTASEGELSEHRWMRTSVSIQRCPGQRTPAGDEAEIPPTRSKKKTTYSLSDFLFVFSAFNANLHKYSLQSLA